MTKDEICYSYKDFFEGMKKGFAYSRLGKTFATTNNFYFYDTGTGKVLSTNFVTYKILEVLFEKNQFDAIFELGFSNKELTDALEEMKETFLKENILQATPVLNMVGPQVHSLEESVMGDLNQITLEITERCNFRCDYCIYTDSYESFREFGNKDMSIEVAKRAIDDLNIRSKYQPLVNIGFYGGEPLLRFEFIKECISYAQEVIKDKELTFSFTSNMSLMTQEMAEFFANLENSCIILASIDGPKWIHDSNRKYPNGEGTFDDVIRGLKYAFDAFEAVNKAEMIHFSIVVSYGNYNEILSDIKRFIHETPWIPNDTMARVSNVSVYRAPTDYTGLNSHEEREYFAVDDDSYVDPILKWAKKESENNVIGEPRYTSNHEELVYYRIHSRPIYNKPIEHYPMNGCCIPFARRTYVSTEGDYSICEKVGDGPSVGNVFDGLDIQKIKKYYVEDYIAEATKYCRECWAINICSECFIDCFDKDGVNFRNRHLPCRANRYLIYQDLRMYHEILESNPESLQYLNDVVIK